MCAGPLPPVHMDLKEIDGAWPGGGLGERKMAVLPYESALIVGSGEGLSASLARLLAREGMRIALAARNEEKLAALARETQAEVFACDASDRGAVERLFADVERKMGAPHVV